MSEAKRVSQLRKEMKRRGWDGFFVPRTDEFQGEYVPACAERLAWLTGFTGSAGLAIVLEEAAAVFVDGRYTLQVREEVDLSVFTARHITDEPPAAWLKDSLRPGAKVAYDPWLHTPDQRQRMERAVEAAGGKLVAAEENLVDCIWVDRPSPPMARVEPHPLSFSGEASLEKRQRIAQELKKKDAQALFLSAPDSIAWLLNIRGGDVPHVPLALSFALLHDDGVVEWFVEQEKLPEGGLPSLDDGVKISSPQSMKTALASFEKKRILLDYASAPEWVRANLEGGGAEVLRANDPCQLPKACKNETELQGTRAAHRRDGLALTRFLCWLDAQVAAGMKLDELTLAERLLAFRRDMPNFRDLSFDTIAGSGPNGAIVHYRVSEKSNRQLRKGDLFLLDSGAQYLDGTTDVTRTIAIGEVGREEARAFTLVLKGHIALARARFPKGTTGSQLDSIARYPLWLQGLDFDHGTGHGVGSYLSVHEGPQRISKVPNTIGLEPGMIVSNEPGYYKTDAFGIRIENLVAVVADEADNPDGRRMYRFETLTLAPIDRRLVLTELLSAEEREWLNDYHAAVYAAHAAQLDENERAWLETAVAPVVT